MSFPPTPPEAWASVVLTHSAAFADIRALIQSMVRADLLSSSSRVAVSICSRSENRNAKVVCGTDVREVVLVVTKAWSGHGEPQADTAGSYHSAVGQRTVVFGLLGEAQTIRRVHVRRAKLIRRCAGLAILAESVA